MEDIQVLKHIENLRAEEERIYSSNDLTDADINRLHIIKIESDQYWDFLRQRRAYRNAGEDPSIAQIRSANMVENYLQ